MKMKRIIILLIVTSVFFLLVNAIPDRSREEVKFSTNTHMTRRDVNFSFVVEEPCEIRFNYASKDLWEGTSILFTNDKTKEVVFIIDNQDNSDLLIRDIPAGRYRFQVNYKTGNLAYRLYAVTKSSLNN